MLNYLPRFNPFFFFFFNDTATTEIYTLSLHDALPISWERRTRSRPWLRPWLPASCPGDRKSTRLNSSHLVISYAVFCLKKKNFECGSARSTLLPHRLSLYSYVVVHEAICHRAAHDHRA